MTADQVRSQVLATPDVRVPAASASIIGVPNTKRCYPVYWSHVTTTRTR